jgi:DNA adenine methylase
VRYLGSKRRIANKIINYIELEREHNSHWVEPFVGSCSILAKAKGKRIGSDINKQLIAMFKALQNGWIPPDEVTEDDYNNIKNNQTDFSDYLVAFVGFGCSFGGKYFAGYAKDSLKKRNYALESKNALLKISSKIKDVKLYHCQYYDLNIPPKSIIYCDPPYKNTTGYGFDFNHDEFYQWCRNQVKKGHKVYISEYDSPFKEIWSHEISCELDKKAETKTEKLYSVHEPLPFLLRGY